MVTHSLWCESHAWFSDFWLTWRSSLQSLLKCWVWFPKQRLTFTHWAMVRDLLKRDIGLNPVPTPSRKIETIPSNISLFLQCNRSHTLILRYRDRFVRVTGTIRVFSGKRHINTNIVRLIEDPMEIYYHFNEVMAQTMLIRRGKVRVFHNTVH